MRQVNPHWTKSKSIAISHALNYRLASFESMRRHGAKNADYRGGVTCLYDTQLLGACLHASECGGRSRPEAVRGMPDVPIAPPATGPPEGWAAVGFVSPASFNRGLWARLLRVLGS